MTQASGPGLPIQTVRAEDARGLAVLLLAALLAVGTALPQLGPQPPGAAGGTQASPRMAEPRTAPGRALAKPLRVLPLDLNTADALALQALPGIGPALAERIVAYREAHGPFQRVEELLDVPGIGPKRWERIRPRVQPPEGP